MGPDNPRPKSRKGIRRWIKRSQAYSLEISPAAWHDLLDADTDFTAAQAAVAAVPIASPADLYAMASASVVYDEVKIPRRNQASIGRAVADYLVRRDMAVTS